MTLIERLRAEIDRQGTNPAAVSKGAGLNHTAVRDILSGKSKSPKVETIEKIARILRVSTGYLLHGDDLDQHTNNRIANIRLVGEVQAGVWKEAVEFEADDQQLIPIPVGSRKHVDKLYLLRARGDSMNQANMPDGTYLICMSMYDFTSYVRDVHPGDFVIAYRHDGHNTEATVKELEVRPDGSHWLWPRSDNPEHQAPIKIGPISDWQDGAPHQVEIAAVVVGHFSLNLPTN